MSPRHRRACVRRRRRDGQQGALFPPVSASASVQRQRQSLAALGFGNGSVTDTLYNAGLNVSYTLDAFGGIRRQVEQLGARAEYQRFELEATDLALAANVINTAINEAALQAQIDTTNDIIKSDTDALNLTKSRFQLGGVSQVDVLQQQSLLDTQVATLPGLEKQRQQLRNQLAVYLGGRPDQYSTPTLDLDHLTLPRDLPVSLPSKLVEQRPDIRAFEALLHSATAQVGVATANMLPNISLSASLGREGTTFANLFTPAGIVWTIAGSLAQPIFEGGTLSARRCAAQAAMEVAAAQYSSTVNTAFQNVANALVAIERDAETLRASLAAQKAASASLAVARSQYAAGVART
jgi:NodT family efflux transporter outer membrane factor (OMF) lipoprotein